MPVNGADPGVIPQLAASQQIPERPEAGDEHQGGGPVERPLLLQIEAVQLHQQATDSRAEQQRAVASEPGSGTVGLAMGAAAGEQRQHGGHVRQQADIEGELVRAEEGQDGAATLPGDPAIRNSQTERVSKRAMGQNQSGGRNWP